MVRLKIIIEKKKRARAHRQLFMACFDAAVGVILIKTARRVNESEEGKKKKAFCAATTQCPGKRKTLSLANIKN